MIENEARLRNELEQLLNVIDDQQSEIDALRNQIEDISDLVIILMRNVKLK